MSGGNPLSLSLNRVLSSVADSLWPEIKSIPLEAYNKRFGAVSDVRSSLALQILLYFHAVYTPVWWLMTGALLSWKSYAVEQGLGGLTAPEGTGTFVTVGMWLFFVLAGIVEPVRIYAGYAGNLQERIPHLTAFFLLSLFPALPLSMFWLFAQSPRVTLDTSLSLLQLAFLLPEIVLGYTTVKSMIRKQAQRFYYEQAARNFAGTAPR